MQNTYHHLVNFVPKMGSITGTVSFTDSTVYSDYTDLCSITLKCNSLHYNYFQNHCITLQLQ